MKAYPKTVVSYLWYFFKPYKYLLIGIVISLFISMLFNRLPSYYFSQIIDIIIAHQEHRDISWTNQIIPILLIILGIEILFNLIRRLAFYFAQFVIPNALLAIKLKTTQHILNYSPNFLASHQAGNFAERLFKLVGETRNIFWLTFFDIGIPLINLVVITGLLIWVNFIFGLIFIFWVGLLLFLMHRTSKKTQKYSYDAAEKASISSGQIIDIITNFLIVKTFANFSFEKRLLKPKLNEERDAVYKSISKVQNSRVLQVFIMTLFYLNTVIYAIYLWQKDVISAGDIVFVVLLINNTMQGFSALIITLLNYNQSIGAINNSLEFFSSPYDVVDAKNAHKLIVDKGSIEFKNLNFFYNKSTKVFDNFNLTISAKEKVGIVGISGNGKTTLINLLQRFYDLDEGQILIDGQDISQVTSHSLHKSLSIIPQDTTLFNRSLLDNIRYGNPHATLQEVIEASKNAYADEFINKRDTAYDTLVGERGIKLSGGQKQRIAIARAILKDSPILILDEATSSLDTESEKRILLSMNKLMKNKTVIVIAHRLSTLRKMDRIIVLDKGKIVEQGSPAELLRKKGKYAKLWYLQSKV